MRWWASKYIVLSIVFALAPAARASRIIKANASKASASAPTHLGRPGMPVVVDSPLPLEAPTLGSGVLPVHEGSVSESEKIGLKAHAYAVEVQGRENPVAAAKFLEDDATRGWLRENKPKRHRELFEKAAGINDLRLTLQTYDSPDTLRLALAARSNLKQASSPQALLAWIDSDPSLAQYRSRVEEAFWEWNYLPEKKRAELLQIGITAENWSRWPFNMRKEMLRPLGMGALQNAGVGRMPGSDAELQGQKNAIHEAWPTLSEAERREWNEKFSKGMLAFQKLQVARKKLAGNFMQGPREALYRAEKESNPDTVLHLLREIFDGVGAEKESRAVRTVASALPEQRFTDAHRKGLAMLLKRHLPTEISGTSVGERLNSFYAKHPLRITVKEIQGGAFAQYDPAEDRIFFNEAIVLDFIRARGIALDALFKDGESLRDLIALLASQFVHEGVHQTQFDALARMGVPPATTNWYDSSMEVEAFSMQDLYIHEKARGSERHRKLYIEQQRLVRATRSDLANAQLLRDNPGAFRSRILGAYPTIPGISGMAHRRLGDGEEFYRSQRDARRIIGAELANRKRLPRAERQRREREGIDQREWSKRSQEDVTKIKTSVLRASLRYREEDQGWLFDVYDYMRDRYSESLYFVMSRLKELYPAMRGTVPTPAVQKEMKLAASHSSVEKP